MGKVTRFKLKQTKDVLDHKLHIDWGKGGKEQNGWYWLDGRKTLRIFLPHQHGMGSGDSVTQDVYHSLKNNLKLSPKQLADLLDCPMTGSDFEAFIRSKNLA